MQPKGIIEYETKGAFVVGHSPDSFVNETVDRVTLRFAFPIITDTLGPEDVTIETPSGPLPPELHDHVTVEEVDSRTYEIRFPTVSGSGAYTVIVGPHVEDLTGVEMDQDGNGIPGEETDIYNATFTIDTTPPMTELATAPSAPDGLDGWFITQPQITLSADDAGIGAKEIHYWWNEGTPTVVEGDSATFLAPPGVNTLHYFAVDGLDQAEDEQQLVISHDDSAPSISIGLAGALGAAGQYEGDVTAAVVAEGDGVAIQSVEIEVDDAGWTEYAGPIAVTGEGAHSVRARITTVRGRTVEAEESFIIDFNPPITVLETDPTEPNGQAGWFVIWAPTITLTATDAGGSVQEIRYRWNGEAETVVAGASAAFAALEGANTLHYYAVDEFGHAEGTQQTEIKFDPKEPDLVVESVAVEPSVGVLFGDVVTVTWLVRNVGEGQAAFGWFDRISLSAPGLGCSEPTLAVRPSNVALLPNDSYSATASVRLPTGLCYEAGQYSMVVTTNFTHTQVEADQLNNSASSDPISVAVPPMPDLVVIIITAPSEGFARQMINVTWEVKNEGEEAATGPWADSVYISDDDQIGGDVLLGTFTFDEELAPQESYLRTKQFTLPGEPGDYWLIVRTDAHDSVKEHEGESNNSVVDDYSVLVRDYTVTVNTDV